MTAISEVLKVNVENAYFDGRSKDGNVKFVKLNKAIDENEAPLPLIYRRAPCSTHLVRHAH